MGYGRTEAKHDPIFGSPRRTGQMIACDMSRMRDRRCHVEGNFPYALSANLRLLFAALRVAFVRKRKFRES